MTSHTIEVSLLDDDIFELNEVFIGNLVFLSSDDTPLDTIDPDMADITINDDDCKEHFYYTCRELAVVKVEEDQPLIMRPY